MTQCVSPSSQALERKQGKYHNESEQGGDQSEPEIEKKLQNKHEFFSLKKSLV